MTMLIFNCQKMRDDIYDQLKPIFKPAYIDVNQVNKINGVDYRHENIMSYRMIIPPTESTIVHQIFNDFCNKYGVQPITEVSVYTATPSCYRGNEIYVIPAAHDKQVKVILEEPQ